MKPRHVLLGALPVAVLLGAGTASGGQPVVADTFSFAFTTAKAKKAAGYTVSAEFPTQRIIDQLTITLPKGTRVNTGAATECTVGAEDYGNEALSEVCPAASKIGTGTGTAFLGDNPTPTTFDLEYYNHEEGALIDILLNGQHAFMSPVDYRGRKLVIDLSLTPELNARITAFSVDIKKAGTAKRPVFRTPATCPKSRRITASITARENGAGSVTTRDSSRCKR